MLEPDEGKLSRPVLRRGGESNLASLSRRVPGNRHSYCDRPSQQTSPTTLHPCTSFSMSFVTCAIMESRTSREVKHQAGRTGGGLCRGGGSGDRPPAPAR